MLLGQEGFNPAKQDDSNHTLNGSVRILEYTIGGTRNLWTAFSSLFLFLHFSSLKFSSSLPSILLPRFSASFLGRCRQGKTPHNTHINLTILTRPGTWSFIRGWKGTFVRQTHPTSWYLTTTSIHPAWWPLAIANRDKYLNTLVKPHNNRRDRMSWVWPPPHNNLVRFSDDCVASRALPLAAPPPFLPFTTSFPNTLFLGWHKVIHKKRFPCSCQKRGGVCLTALHPGWWRIRCELCYQFFLLFFICHVMFRKFFLLSSASGG